MRGGDSVRSSLGVRIAAPRPRTISASCSRSTTAAVRASGFEAGIQTAIERLLSSPKFLFRIERSPASVEPGAAYPLTDVELASRLSFFLWSSIPDDELLEQARPASCRSRRCTRHKSRACSRTRKRARSSTISPASGSTCATSTASCRTPSGFPNFDDNLRQGLRRRPSSSSRASSRKIAASSI